MRFFLSIIAPFLLSSLLSPLVAQVAAQDKEDVGECKTFNVRTFTYPFSCLIMRMCERDTNLIQDTVNNDVYICFSRTAMGTKSVVPVIFHLPTPRGSALTPVTTSAPGEVVSVMVCDNILFTSAVSVGAPVMIYANLWFEWPGFCGV